MAVIISIDLPPDNYNPSSWFRYVEFLYFKHFENELRLLQKLGRLTPGAYSVLTIANKFNKR